METQAPERIRLMGWVPRADFLSAVAGTFGQLVRLSREVGHTHYLGDLYHDATTLGELVAGMVTAKQDAVSFYWLARESGTSMWTNPEDVGTFRGIWKGAAIWHLTVSWEQTQFGASDGVWYVTIERVA